MRSELQKKLIEKYPKFFDYLKDYEGPIMPMVFGFEVGDGWYWLLDNLMNSIYNYCTSNKVEVPNLTQVKEKYGALCFYYNGGDELINGMVWLAENLSYEICETCGTQENIIHTEGWVMTICKDCENKRQKEMKKENYLY